jgi:hypothetical protein
VVAEEEADLPTLGRYGKAGEEEDDEVWDKV